MHICLCHPFNDKKVKEHLGSTEGSVRVSDPYKACSGGETPNCCACLDTLKDIVTAHNKTAQA